MSKLHGIILGARRKIFNRCLPAIPKFLEIKLKVTRYGSRSFYFMADTTPYKTYIGFLKSMIPPPFRTCSDYKTAAAFNIFFLRY